MRALRLAAAAITLIVTPLVLGSALTTLSHERLRLRNTFKTPEEVVSYYCARDASGFVWSGLLDAERRAFTTWDEAPQQDSFYVARKYDISPKAIVAAADHAQVRVRYEIVAVGDGHGTTMPAPKPEYEVVFDLRKVGSTWKIARPSPEEISPVVLEAKFPR